MGEDPSACYLLPSTDLWGGVKVAFEQAEQLAARGWTVTVVSTSGPPDWYELSAPFVRVPDFGGRHLPRADLYVGTFFTTVPAAHDTGLGIGAHLVQGYEADYPDLAAHRESIEFAYSLRTAKIAVSRHLAEQVEERYGHGVYRVRNGIDSAIFHPRARKGRAGRRPRVGVVGPRSVGWKGVDVALAGLAGLRASGHSFEVVRLSQEPLGPDERALLDPDEYHLSLSPDAVGDLLRTLDILVSASTAVEGFGLPAMEAMACGCACVLSDIPAYREFGLAAGVAGEYAQIAPLRDAGEVAAAVGPLLLDAARRDELGALGASMARRYRWEIVGDELDVTLRRLVAHERERWETRDERMVPGENDRLTETMHRQRYDLAAPLATGLRVIDVGCGVGYGSRALADAGATEVLALDRSAAALRHARAHYGHPAISWREVDLVGFDWPEGACDLAVLFEVFEHVHVPLEIVAGIARALDDEGCALISTPNRAYYSPTGEPDYVHHVREYELAEFHALLDGCFERVCVVGQRVALGSLVLGPADPSTDMAFIATCRAPRAPRPATRPTLLAAPGWGHDEPDWRALVAAWPEAAGPRSTTEAELRLLARSPARAARLAADVLRGAGYDPDQVPDIAIVGVADPLRGLGRHLPEVTAVCPLGPDRERQARLAAAAGLPALDPEVGAHPWSAGAAVEA